MPDFSFSIRSMLLVCIWLLAGTINNLCGKTLSWEDHLELEKQFKILNRPAVKTIQTIYGNTYDCVKFHQQPAFDHPLLKNQTSVFQIPSTSFPRRRENLDSSTTYELKNIWLDADGCPIGTVPIKRTTEEDIIRAKEASKIYASSTLDSNYRPGVHNAVLRTTSHGKYYGGGMRASLWNPQVRGTQYSSGQMKIQNGPESIILGWTVNPAVYKDSRTRFFIYTTYADGSQCFNTYCPGFVILSTQYPLDYVFDPTSTRGKPIYDWQFFVYKDKANGNWFLSFGNDTILGYWPQQRFNSLADSATYMEWGGEVYSPPGIPSPPMGSGRYFEEGDTRFDAFCRDITYIKEAREVIDVGDDVSVFSDIPKYYAITYLHDLGSFRQYILYGGSGGYKG